MQPQEAAALAAFLLEECRFEGPVTRKVLAAVPQDQPDYRPDPVSKTALELAWHIASAEVWFLNSIADGKFVITGEGEGALPAEVKTPADVVAWYDNNAPAAVARAAAMTPEELARNLDFMGAFNLPAVVYISLNNRHSIHHRGQLSAYLRAMGGKVPAIYGGSADDPWKDAAASAS